VFSGIIEAVGKVVSLVRHDDDARLEIAGLAASTLAVGESICTSGVCLTVREVTRAGFVADLSAETLRRTNLNLLREGAVVNLERSLRLGDRLSGHFVFGHVDGVGRITALDRSGDGHWLRVATDAELTPYLVDKGSIAVDGISLTMCDVGEASFAVAVIPHTFEVTTLSQRKIGDLVNLEVDMLARYARRALETLTGRP
jgi:riboflavin synthase